MKQRIRQTVIVGVLACCMFVAGVQATPAYGGQIRNVAGGAVTIKLPDFPVTMNGQRIDNRYSQYPLIVYKDITYFPMTYSDCRFLGVESIWQGHKEGLCIEKTGVSAAYIAYRAGVQNGTDYTAVIPNFPITVNGKVIDNRVEQYPILSFRNITYFPMTWNWGVGEFGWDYKFDKTSGLVISSANTKITQRPFPKSLTGNVAVTDKHVYYQGEAGQIMWAPLDAPNQSKKIYQIEQFSEGEYSNIRLYGQGTDVFLTFHRGGATMGTDYRIRFSADGTAVTEKDSNNLQITDGNRTVVCNQGVPPYQGNLTVQEGSAAPRDIGDDNVLYGWHWSWQEGVGGGGIPDDRAYIIGDDLYIFGFDMKTEKNGNRVCKVNLKTGESTSFPETSSARDFCIEGGKLYYCLDLVQSIDLKTGAREQTGIPTAVPYGYTEKIEILSGTVYCKVVGVKANQAAAPFENPVYSIKTLPESVGEEILSQTGAEDLEIKGTADKYVICTYEEKDATKYRIAVFSSSGKLVFKSSDRAKLDQINIIGDSLYFYDMTVGAVCTAPLK